MGKKSTQVSSSKIGGDKIENTTATSSIKKIDKKKKFKKKKQTGTSVAKLPASKTEYSANWKQMLLTLEKDPKPASKTHPANSKFKSFRDKKGKEVSAKNTANIAKKPDIWFDVKDDTLLDLEDRPTPEVMHSMSFCALQTYFGSIVSSKP